MIFKRDHLVVFFVLQESGVIAVGCLDKTKLIKTIASQRVVGNNLD